MNQQIILERARRMLSEGGAIQSHPAQKDLEPMKSDLPFQVGQKVSYRIPIIKKPTNYSWQEHLGVIQSVDPRMETVTLKPETEKEPWRVVAWVYVKPCEEQNEKV